MTMKSSMESEIDFEKTLNQASSRLTPPLVEPKSVVGVLSSSANPGSRFEKPAVQAALRKVEKSPESKVLSSIPQLSAISAMTGSMSMQPYQQDENVSYFM